MNFFSKILAPHCSALDPSMVVNIWHVIWHSFKIYSPLERTIFSFFLVRLWGSYLDHRASFHFEIQVDSHPWSSWAIIFWYVALAFGYKFLRHLNFIWPKMRFNLRWVQIYNLLHRKGSFSVMCLWVLLTLKGITHFKVVRVKLPHFKNMRVRALQNLWPINNFLGLIFIPSWAMEIKLVWMEGIRSHSSTPILTLGWYQTFLSPFMLGFDITSVGSILCCLATLAIIKKNKIK